MKNVLMIIGTGLIGGSLGLALRESPLVSRVTGFDEEQECLQKARAIGAIDEIVTLAEGVQQADIVCLCTPLNTYQTILSQIMPFLKPGTIVTDTGSTKESVMEWFEMLPERVWGIGGHPMAGSEIKGINGADRYLFENAVYVLTPGKTVPADVTSMLETILAGTGASIIKMDPSLHDELAAVISHVPHLAAVSLVNLTGGDAASLMLAAGGFRDTTRIASSNPVLWQDILMSNRQHISAKLRDLIDNLTMLERALVSENNEELNRMLIAAKEIRDQIPQRRKGLLPGWAEIVCIVPDHPGVIGELGLILGQKGINIVDIEILRVREGDGGTIRLGVSSPEDAQKAVDCLQSHAIKAWLC